jgi:peptide/nickel transport system ATP-binding protein
MSLIEVRGLKKWFPIQQGFLQTLFAKEIQHVRAVDGVEFDIVRGEVFGLVGESGSGKTTTGRLILRLTDPTEGRIVFDGVDLVSLDEESLRQMRRRMQPIFQDPFASLNPRMKLGDAIAHGLDIHGLTDSGAETRDRVLDMMEKVGLTPPDQIYRKYPHQISGGQRQRAVIARALVLNPELMVADEPVAMADVSVRAVLIDLMIQLKDELNLTYLFITHDLATAKYICDRIAVMYLGRIAEIGSLRAMYADPKHPYTQALIAAVPVPDPKARRGAAMPSGEIPSPINPPSGCRFHPRCPHMIEDTCPYKEPELKPVGDGGHLVACHLYD